jgi:hypothetical protein
MILNEIRNAAAASAPPYPAASSSPSWPTGGNNALTANYMIRDPNDLGVLHARRAPRRDENGRVVGYGSRRTVVRPGGGTALVLRARLGVCPWCPEAPHTVAR